MLKKQLLICLMVLFGLVHMGAASAATLSFDPGSQNVGLNDSVTVDLRISGLGDDILTGFDLDVGFDASILSFQGFTFGTGLDVGGFGLNITDVVDFGGVVNVYEVSFDTDQELKDFPQPNDFVLGTFNFGTLNYGTSALSIAVGLGGVGLSGECDLFDPSSGDCLSVSELDMQVQNGSVSVVPVPAAIWLFGSALMGLIGLSRRTSRA